MLAPFSSRPTDRQLESAVARVLAVGVSVAAIIVLIGGILYLGKGGPALPDYQHFQPITVSSPILGTLYGARHGYPKDLIQAGLLLLIATPVARVVLCFFGFALQRNRLYTLISAIVLAILLYSLIHAHA